MFKVSSSELGFVVKQGSIFYAVKKSKGQNLGVLVDRTKTKNGKRYLKLVNALPSTLKISIKGIDLPTNVKCQQFTGAIDDQKAKTVEIETNEPTTLPPYSLRIIEL